MVTQSHKTKAGLGTTTRLRTSGVCLSKIPQKCKMIEKTRAEHKRVESHWLGEMGTHEKGRPRKAGMKEAMLRNQGTHCGQTAKRNEMRKRKQFLPFGNQEALVTLQ